MFKGRLLHRPVYKMQIQTEKTGAHSYYEKCMLCTPTSQHCACMNGIYFIFGCLYESTAVHREMCSTIASKMPQKLRDDIKPVR